MVGSRIHAARQKMKAADGSRARPRRLVFLTFHKSGSQWIRDVLTDGEVLGATGLQRFPDRLSLFERPWPQQPSLTFAGPFYDASYEDWNAHRLPDDRALIVLRDPRDIVVSWVYSAALSHPAETPLERKNRQIVQALPPRDRLLQSIRNFAQRAGAFRSWGGLATTEHELVTTYEQFLHSPLASFSRIRDFFGWHAAVPDEAISRAIARHSFLARSGREPGNANPFSHFRKASPGDWRNHFDRDMGEIFERLFPDLLVACGYERSSDWYTDLPPENPGLTAAAPLTALPDLHAKLSRLGSYVRMLRQIAAGRRQRFLAPRLGHLHHHRPRPVVIPARYRRPPALPTWPSISVITATLNSAVFLERAIQSLQGQAYPALEHIVQDGGSTDETLQIVDRYRDGIASVRSEPDAGQADALNWGFRRATGDILAYLNSDDLLLPGALHAVAAFFTDHPDVDVVYGHRVLIDECDREIGRWVLPPHDDDILSWADYVPQETLFWRRRIWDRVGARLDESFQFAMDWDLLLRFRAAGARFARLPRFLGAFRVHAGQKTSAQMAGIGRREMDRLRERVHGHPVSPEMVRRHVLGYLTRHVLYQKLYRLGILRY